MIELTEIEIDEVDGGMGFVQFLQWANYALEFLTGLVDGVNSATNP